MNELTFKLTKKDKDIQVALTDIRSQLNNELQGNTELILYLFYYSGILLQKLQYDTNISEYTFAKSEHSVLNDISQIEERENASPQLLFNFIRDINYIEMETKVDNPQFFLNKIYRMLQNNTYNREKYGHR